MTVKIVIHEELKINLWIVNNREPRHQFTAGGQVVGGFCSPDADLKGFEGASGAKDRRGRSSCQESPMGEGATCGPGRLFSYHGYILPGICSWRPSRATITGRGYLSAIGSDPFPYTASRGTLRKYKRRNIQLRESKTL